MEKSVALFYCKNISKKFKKVFKNLLTNTKRCVIIVSQSKRMAQKRKNEVFKMKRFLFVLRVFKDDGKSTTIMYRSYESETVEQAREMLKKECAEKNRVCMVERTYIEYNEE